MVGLQSEPLLKAPVDVLIELTGRCNLRCSYCFHFDSASENCKDLPTDEWLRFLEELQSLNVFNITFTGGEVFTMPDFPAIFTRAAQCNLRYTILSNGTLISEEHAAAISAAGRCAAIQISLDGIGEVNDSARGKGAFDAAVRGIKLLQKYNLKVYPRLTIGRHNLGKLRETADFIINELGIPRFGTNAITVPVGNTKDTESLELSIHEFAASMREHQEVLKIYPGSIGALSGPLGSLKRWRKLLETKEQGLEMLYGGCHGTCMMVFKRIAVRPDGGIVACSAFPEHVMGYINKDKLSDVWANGEFINQIRAMRYKPLTEYNYCQDCEFIHWCLGSCPSTAWEYSRLTGEVTASRYCLRKFLELFPDFDFYG